MSHDISQSVHKEASERKMRKIAESKHTSASPEDFARYMFRNLELAKEMERDSSK